MAGGQFRLDPEAMPQIVSDLREARQHLVELISEVGMLVDHGPVGGDEVSRNVVHQFKRLGLDSEPGSLGTAARSYLAAMDESIAALETMLKDYLRADEFVLPAAADFDGTVRPGHGSV